MVVMIPWAAILKHAPTILATADALRARVKATDAGDRTRNVETRLAELEADTRAAAQLTQDIAQQINALAAAHASAARQARAALMLGIAAVVLAIAAVGVSLLR